MNFLKTLGGFVGSGAMGGLPYVPDTAPAPGSSNSNDDAGAVYDLLPDFQLLSGRSRADPTQRVSIFRSKAPHAQLAQNALRRTKTLRHPNILSFMDGTEVANTGIVLIVTEHVVPLAKYLDDLRVQYGATSDEFHMSVSWGLRSVLLALQFITGDCKLLHGRLNPHSIFVTKGGDWKLGGFEMTAEITADGPSYVYTAFEQTSDANFKPPECLKRDWRAIATNPPSSVDMFAFACLLYYVYNDSVVRSSELAAASNIPVAIKPQYRKAIDAVPTRRPTPDKVLASSFFATPFIQRMDFLENLAVKSSDEKVAFYKDLCANLASLPQAFGVYKVLPALKAVVDFGAGGGSSAKHTLQAPVKLDPSASHMLPAMVQIGSSLSADAFKAQVLPILVKLFSCNDRAVRVQLLQMMESFAIHLDAKLVNSSVIFDNLCSGFTDAAPALRELTVKSMLHISDKLSDTNLNTRVMKYFAKLQTDPEPAIRTNTTICLGKIASKLNDATRPKVLFPAFARAMKDPFPHARLAGLRSLTACETYFSIQGVAGNIVPAIAPLLIDVSLSVREQAALSMELFMKRVMDEAAQMKIREVTQAREQQQQQQQQLQQDALSSSLGGGNSAAAGASTTTTPASASYAASLTSWAASAVTSNVNKIVGAGAIDAAPLSTNSNSSNSSSSAYVPASSNYTTAAPSSSSGGMQLTGSRTNSNSQLSSAFAAADLGMDDDDDPWGDNDHDDNVDADDDDLFAPTSRTGSRSSSSATKLSVARTTTSRTPPKTVASLSLSAGAESGWGDDNWGGDHDADLDFDAPARTSSFSSNSSRTNSSRMNSRTGSTKLATSFGVSANPQAQTAASLLMGLTATPSVSVAGASSVGKPVSERLADAKAKREQLGAMKLSTTTTTTTTTTKKKGDEWDNWDF